MQFNLSPAEGERRDLYADLAVTAREFLAEGGVRNVFFMHKEPGLRVRFQLSQARAEAAREALGRRVSRLPGLRAAPVGAVYEPESYLFGGPGSMPFAHDLFTLDSLAWLDHHVDTADADADADADIGTAPVAGWRWSLLVLREMFAGLGIAGWEHRGVWETVRSDTGRRLGGQQVADARVQRAAEGIRAQWVMPRAQALAVFPVERAGALVRHLDAVGEAARRWRTGWFEAGAAAERPVPLGPRQAVAYVTVFHWNRGLVSWARQSLIAEALVAEGSRDAARIRVGRGR
ncbi:thiopeptide-type bacteriocin biosynthesis protein [Streptomyces sp. NPDC088341]|uniref:thiopeptide-type bacteriocin biosynthesis protein n=1 Tax=Streptomyces sp. NPDC088341 TaxID=3154870 RepID=UPI00342C6B92